MCGIVGYFTTSQKPSAQDGLQLVKTMSQSLSHRGPDADGHWFDAEAGIYLGHRRLSIQDLSSSGAQPMTSHCGRYVIIFNGEIYNAAKIIDKLKTVNANITFKGHSDTEILLEAFALLGLSKTLSIIKGMFAIALWDKKERTLFLARDHIGKKPLYIGWVDGKIAFASELKALKILAHSGLDINHEAMDYYNYFGFIPAPHSIYKGIFKLEAGHFIVLNEQDINSKSKNIILEKSQLYWQVKKPAQQLETGAWQEQLKQILQNAVKGRMVSDVPLGAFLSGGIDSSLITALMQEQSDTKIKTYSIGFENAAFDESRHAAKVAAHLKTDHTSYMVTPEETLQIIPELPNIYDEPFADYSQIPTAILCQQASKDTVVAISGDGGDEVFCGYKRYFLLKKLLDTSNNLPYAARKAIALALSLPSQGAYNKLHMNGKRIHSIAGFLQEKTLEDATLRTLSINPAYGKPATLDLNNLCGLNDLERMMMIDTQLYLPDDILVKVDRASMFSSLEVRSPLLDKDVIEFAWSMTIENKIFPKEGRGKRPLYDLLCEYVPKEIIDRPKQGFSPPIADWLRESLKDWAGDLLNEETPLYERGYMQKHWSEFLSGQADHHNALWGMLMAQAWYLNNH